MSDAARALASPPTDLDTCGSTESAKERVALALSRDPHHHALSDRPDGRARYRAPHRLVRCVRRRLERHARFVRARPSWVQPWWVIDPSANTWRVDSGGGRLLSGPATTRFNTNPRIHQLASGSIFVSGMSSARARAQRDGSFATWTETGSTAFGDRLFGASLLFAGRGGGDPDRVFVLGGARWPACASGSSPRDDHSAAVLLPGRSRARPRRRVAHVRRQIDRPWRLTTGALRPELVSAPETIGTVASGVASFGVTHAPLPIGREIDHAVLLRPGTITHHSDFDARYVRLRTTSTSPTTVLVEAPADTKQTPRGWYMLFLVSNERVPSVAAWVKVP